MISRPGTGDLEGTKGVKTAKLCVEQDQIGKHANSEIISKCR